MSFRFFVLALAVINGSQIHQCARSRRIELDCPAISLDGFLDRRTGLLEGQALLEVSLGLPLGAPAILGLLGSERPEASQLGGVEVEQHLAGQGFHLLAGDLHGDRPPVGEDLQLGEWPLDVG